MASFTTDYRVIYSDCDPFNVVYYANYFDLFERGRTELFREMGIPYSEVEKQGIYVPVTETKCNFKRSARYDDLLQIDATVLELKRVSVKIGYRIFRSAPQELLAEGYTVHAFVNMDGKPRRIPQEIVERINAFAAAEPAN